VSQKGNAHAKDKMPPKPTDYSHLYFDIAGVILMAMDSEGRITLLNRKGCEILGYDKTEIIGMSWFDFVPERNRSSVQENFTKLMSGEFSEIEYIERPILVKSGEERIIGWRSNVLRNDQGEIFGIISSGEDVTERKRAEVNLEKRTFELGERVKELVCLYETSRFLTSGLSIEEIFQNLIYLIQNAWQYPDLTCVRIQHDDKTYHTDNFRETEWNQHSTIYFDGIEIGSFDVYYLEELPDEDEGPFLKEERDLIDAISENITIFLERLASETKLLESEERYRTLVQSMNDLVFVFDSDNKYTQYYASEESSLSMSPESFLGVSISDVLPENIADIAESTFQQIRESGESKTFDYPLQIEGRELWFSSASSLHEDGVSIVSVIRDITKQKELEYQREQHRMELELYSSLLHHDLGNDLHVIMGYLQIAEMELDLPKAEVHEMFGPVKNATERMQNLLSALGSPREEIQTEMLQLVSKVAAKAQQVHKGLSIQISVARGVQPLGVASSRLLPMVFENLFRNSVQFNNLDPIIDVELSKVDGKVIVDVSDNGPGIPDEILPNLFQRGVSTTGSGVGLYLVWQILAAYDGSIELIDSKSGSGATFRITIPLKK